MKIAMQRDFLLKLRIDNAEARVSPLCMGLIGAIDVFLQTDNSISWGGSSENSGWSLTSIKWGLKIDYFQ